MSKKPPSEAEIEKQAREQGWARPFKLLVAMTADQRDRIRQWLDFSFGDNAGSSARESWDIINCDLRGLQARLHTKWEQLNPFSANITWRQALQRVAEGTGIIFDATASDEVFEQKVADLLRKGRCTQKGKKGKIDSLPIPGANSIVVDALKLIESAPDIILGSTDEPAYSVVLALCDAAQKAAAKEGERP